MKQKLWALLTHRWLWVGALLGFPVIDYVLRNVVVIPVVSSVWDDGLLLVLAGMAVWKFLEGGRVFDGAVKAALLAFLAFGIGMLVFDMANFGVNIEGFRAQYQYLVALFVGFYLVRGQALGGQAPKDQAPGVIHMRHVLYVFLGVASLVALYGVYQYMVGAPMPAGWVDASESVRTRAYSIVQSPNILGAYMAMATPMAMGLFLAAGKNRTMRAVWLGVTLLLLATLLFTGSRGAWLAFAGSVGLLMIFFDKRFFIVFLVGVVLVGAFVPQVTTRFTQLFSPTYLEKSTNDGRIARWSNAYDQMRTSPVYGVGLGHYGGAVGARNFGTTYVDSYVFKTVAETGLLGLGLFFWVILAIYRSIHRYWRTLRAEKDLSNYYMVGGVYAGLIAVMFHNGVENIFEMPFMNLFWWLLAGALLALNPLHVAKGGDKANG